MQVKINVHLCVDVPRMKILNSTQFFKMGTDIKSHSGRLFLLSLYGFCFKFFGVGTSVFIFNFVIY